MIYELEHELSTEERKDLLFLTGGLKCFKLDELDENSRHNINEYFGYNKDKSAELLKVIIFKDKVVTKLKSLWM
jgi:hypothetical protein